ncbi:hypothetical protein GCM10010136_09110 [Limoniibacter endophyticus]|uniref:Uncharacterized protein n=1 Tax=Limoniibacter endophyticus TaxID=1565040 RepID=A0A8J3DKY8_9HYPH|nr:hypothetical protein GCM10010136_09110 [Limoniibacter endophyticus]
MLVPTDPQNEPGLDQSVTSISEAKRRATAGKGLVIFLAAFVAVGFCLYLLIAVYSGIVGN